MGSSDIGGSKCKGTGSVPQHVQVSPHVGQPTAGTGGDVLDDDEPRAETFDDAPELAPEPRSFATEALALPGARDVLTGESPADEIDPSERASCSDVFMLLHGGPVLLENGATERVFLDLPRDGA
jgi:hypothetical protein